MNTLNHQTFSAAVGYRDCALKLSLNSCILTPVS
jgi:hypothetical protein